MGDASAYGLGSSIILSSLYLFQENIFSAAFLAYLFSYPCIDFVMTLACRLRAGRSIYLLDNDHLHNRIHCYFQRWSHSKTLVNSMTGDLIVASSFGVALMGYIFRWWPVTSNLWFWLFLPQCVSCGVMFYLTGFGSMNIQ